MAEIQDGGYSSELYKKCYALHMFRCPLYIHNTKKACFVRLRGCPYAHTFGCPNMFGCPPVYLDTPLMFVLPPYVWMLPVCLGAPIFGHPLYGLDTPCTFGCPPNVWGIQRYKGHPNIWVVSTYIEVSKHTGGIQTYWGIKTYWGIQMDAPQMYGASKGMREIQTYV